MSKKHIRRDDAVDCQTHRVPDLFELTAYAAEVHLMARARTAINDVHERSTLFLSARTQVLQRGLVVRTPTYR
jgi:hypothetical protein